MEKSINFSSDHILQFGRNETENGSLFLRWAGSGFGFMFRGTELRIKFGAFNSERHFYFQIIVDKIKQTHCVCADDQIVVIRGLSLDVHQVRVTKITECMQSVVIKEVTICGDDAEFLSCPYSPDFKFEFIGDSLTAGFGNMSEPDAGIYRASEQDITFGYSYLIASKFNAEGRYICCSGKGIFNNWDGSKENRITDFYDKIYIGSTELHDFKTWQPDIVFINAGTNDITAKTDPNDFKTAFLDFVYKVHSLNPDAFILCIHGLTTDTFASTFEEIEAELKEHSSKSALRIDFVKFTPISEELYGALGHPNSKAHAHFARELIKVVKKITRK